MRSHVLHLVIKDVLSVIECKPPSTPKFEIKVISDSKSDFRINLDPDVRRIRPKIVDALSCRRQSFRQVTWYKSAVHCMKIEKTDKCFRVTTKSQSLIEGYLLPVPAVSTFVSYPVYRMTERMKE